MCFWYPCSFLTLFSYEHFYCTSFFSTFCQDRNYGGAASTRHESPDSDAALDRAKGNPTDRMQVTRWWWLKMRTCIAFVVVCMYLYVCCCVLLYACLRICACLYAHVVSYLKFSCLPFLNAANHHTLDIFSYAYTGINYGFFPPTSLCWNICRCH